MPFKKSIIILLAVLLGAGAVMAQKPYRIGTTAANFLEVGYGSAGSAMGDAYVSVANDLSSAYWNPAGLAFMTRSEAQFSIQPWLVNINTTYAGVGLALPRVGTLALAVTQVGYGDMAVTTMDYQDGTGELFNASDLAVSFSYARSLAQWFSFGASFKYINSQIWHMNANAMALDLGVMVNTNFFSFSGKREDGMTIGMSISNYGTKMKYDGMDLTWPIDVLPDQDGNYAQTAGQFKLEGWELPLIFRVGVSIHPIATATNRLTLAVDALHPNNNAESINVGAQYAYTLPSTGTFYLRGGYKALALKETEFGPTMGAGVYLRMMGNLGVRFDYAYRDIGMLGNAHCYSIGMSF
ncbi:MAG TPA: PorV/PorQ family protein [bacterium]|nr:PorV/PorQ family protein [bacterium]HPG84298.1 PorV/PorQ family protein [bacterium]HPM60157.1 PorV/PorQ family protein [bacterium]